MPNQQSTMNQEDASVVRGNRAAFLIRCTEAEANMVRSEAKRRNRTISAYVLNVLDLCIGFEEHHVPKRSRVEANCVRTALLIRCSSLESERIRVAARRSEVSVNSFALSCLRRSWTVNPTHNWRTM